MNAASRSLSWLFALALVSLVGCKDSGHPLGDTRDLDAGRGDAPLAAGGNGGMSSQSQAGFSGHSGLSSSTPASSAGNSGGSSGGASSSSGGQGGASTAKDAGANSEVGACGYRDDPCTSRPCCAPLVCTNLGGPMTCHEASRPPPDAALSLDTHVSSDGKCPTCPPMKCSYGSPVGSDGCTLCECNPAPDGGPDTARCPAGGCLDADLSTPCPASPPSNGSACLGQSVCNYEDCPGTGHTQATCRSDKWVIANGACGTVTCLGAGVSGRTCPANKVCLVRAGGALSVECIDNPCGSGLLSADCSTTTTGCTPILSTSSGVTFTCNTCPSGTCA